MTNISGITIVITDADALIGLASEDDMLHQRCIAIQQYLQKHGIETFTPYPIILEAATMLARVMNRRDLAHKLLQDYELIEYSLNTDVFKFVEQLYTQTTSKKNTPFDHYVLALAKKNDIKYVFSFDSFYAKHGLTLAEKLLE